MRAEASHERRRTADGQSRIGDILQADCGVMGGNPALKHLQATPTSILASHLDGLGEAGDAHWDR